MRFVLRVAGGLVGFGALALVALLVAARFTDGPIAIVAGGPFRSGELVSGPEPDWSSVRDVQEVEFQLLEPPRSRTTWILEHAGKVYIPCGYMDTAWGRFWKQWPIEAEQDGRAILRVGRALYERKLVRIADGPLLAPLLAELSRKYLGGNDVPAAAVTSGSLWLFELAPRQAAPAAAAAPAPAQPAANPLRNAYFGAVHVHTSYSFDAFTNGTVSKPSDAYDWAKGKPIQGNKQGLMLKIETPLDFYAVSDHAEMMGVFPRMSDPSSPLSQLPLAARVTSKDPNEAMQAFSEILRNMSAGQLDPALTDPAISRSVWQEIVKTADAHYEPGRFTTFPAFEWTSNPDKRNLHRVVVFRDSTAVPELAYSALQSDRPEDLWKWMDAQRQAGATLFAIPHNANASDGLMFALQDSDGSPLDETDIRARSSNEPLYEISQIKGTSETHPVLSPNDEFAGFELWDYTLSADAERPTQRKGSYARQALLDGLGFARAGKGNPFAYGFIGDSDTHNAAATNEEDNYTGKFAFETEPRHRLNGIPGQPEGQIQQVREFSSGGLAGVWAEENTREGIYDAMLRKETFGTSGPHLRVRFFGGWDFTAADIEAPDWVAAGYARGVPMGGRLAAGPDGGSPSFVVWALKDPNSANLDRVQIVKGWVDGEGAQHEAIFDVAWSGDRKPDAAGKLPPVGNSVDVAKATYDNSIGAAELNTVWSDPSFDRTQHAVYYVRVLEIPTPRWSTRDAAALGVEIPGGLPPTLQERAWSSPIWYSPAPPAP